MQSHLPAATRTALPGTVGAVATLEPVRAGTGEIAFELERFEFKGDDRVEISGRWFGVRGRRFIRPTLTVVTDGRGARALADLEHKPWAAEDGQPWQAAFACELKGAKALEAELNVAPDITITLPAPGGAAATGAKRAKRERSGQATARPAGTAGTSVAAATQRRETLAGEHRAPRDRRDQERDGRGDCGKGAGAAGG